MKPVKYSAYLLFLCIAISGLLYYMAQNASSRVLITQGTPPLIIEFKENSSAAYLISELSQKKLIQHPFLFKIWLKLNGHANHLQAGIYELSTGESFQNLIHRIGRGDVLKFSFTIVEGTRLDQVEKNLVLAPYLNHDESHWNRIQHSYSSLEGLLLADTYQYKAGSSAAALFKKAHQDLNEYLTQAWNHREKDLPYENPYQLLIAASIIEKETALNAEKPLISGVIVNRLKRHMRLQMDPTVIYGLGEQFRPPLNRTDLKINTAYNTYLHKGLPPGPIAMVSRSSIDAAAHPDENAYLYYVAKGDGSHQFSTNYQQQLKAIKQFLKKDKT